MNKCFRFFVFLMGGRLSLGGCWVAWGIWNTHPCGGVDLRCAWQAYTVAVWLRLHVAMRFDHLERYYGVDAFTDYCVMGRTR